MNQLLTTNSSQLMRKSFIFLLLVVSCLLLVSSARAQVNVDVRNIATNITLVWEANSYTPPFYKGRALMPDGGDARIIAFLPPGIPETAGLTYTWRIDGTIDGDNSGPGRKIYELRSPVFGGSPLIVVEVKSGANLIGTGVLRIPVVKPQVLVYADSPLGGVLFNVEKPALSGAELALETYPLFFSTKRRDNLDISYAWQVDGFTVQNPLGNSARIILRSEAPGTTTIGASVSNRFRVLESASGKTSLFLE